jgi:hypothetical protein
MKKEKRMLPQVQLFITRQSGAYQNDNSLNL